ncbi:MAG: hypothetical protein Q9174_003487 [Haloplaca sp. 1 TL-2023]
MQALAQDLAGIIPASAIEVDPQDLAERIESAQNQVSLDRIILLDPLGGIPSPDRDSHVFINLEQEYDVIQSELFKSSKVSSTQKIPAGPRLESALFSNPVTKSPENEAGTTEDEHYVATKEMLFTDRKQHSTNLELLRRTLAILPSSSSGLVTTPENAANANRVPQDSTPEVGTRRQQNPLIHNLLTDKPVFSSSLPSDRMQRAYPAVSPPTFVKRGMPVSIVPDPRTHPWLPPSSTSAGTEAIQLSDPRIDLPRLIHLIEDSFDRKLDVQHYLERIKDRIAGVIIAGEYEGGALLTWESPTNWTQGDPAPLVPYLDKFAVLKRSQGSGGVADIVFKAMVKDCFPSGVCWRSRRDNPVNKWYFERARGTWKLPNSNWTMFWTTDGVHQGNLLKEYESVCRGVMPSWADKKSVID